MLNPITATSSGRRSRLATATTATISRAWAILKKPLLLPSPILGRYPVIGGLALNWDDGGVYIDSSLNLYDASNWPALTAAINNVVHLGRAISKKGVFKSCMFDARKTLHISRKNPSQPFVPDPRTENSL